MFVIVKVIYIGSKIEVVRSWREREKGMGLVYGVLVWKYKKVLEMDIDKEYIIIVWICFWYNKKIIFGFCFGFLVCNF